MATSLSPENTPVPSVQSPEGTTPQPESASPPIPPTSQQPSVPTSDQSNYISLLEASVRESNARIQGQQDEIRQLRTVPTPAQPAAPPPQADPTAFFNDPQGLMAAQEARIKKHFEETVRPLQDFVRGMKGEGTPYGNLKSQFAADPRFATQLANPKIATAVDKILEGQQSITSDLMAGAIIQAAGMEATGQLDAALVRAGVPLSQFSGNQPTQQPMRITPPHVPPTPPSAPIPQPTASAPEPLTELQKRMARERGQTEEQYREWLNVPASAVASSQIGRVAK